MGSQYSFTGPYGHTFSFSEIMGSQYSVTCPYGHTFSFFRDNGSQYSVTGPYGHTFFFLDIKGRQDSVTGPYGHTFSFLDIDGAVKTPSPGPYGHSFFFSRYHGQSRLRHRAIWPHILLSRYHWAVKTSSLVLFYGRHNLLFPRSWVVNTPSPGHLATHSPSPISWAVKTPSLVVLVYGDNNLLSEIMDNQYSVTGPILSSPEINGQS
ncbi:hypothetical protein BgiBS90_038362 [Biomphalaria glabrata]|nr:hypothetical protein BgiBS90_038362 [Biomphalaria glabrata]